MNISTYLAETLKSMILPSSLISTALVWGLLLIVFRMTRRIGTILLASAAILLIAVGTGPVSYLMLGRLAFSPDYNFR